jgi:hypothetical protein
VLVFCRYLRAVETQCDGQELRWVFADMEIVRSVMDVAAAVEDKKSGKKADEGPGVIAACCQWLCDQCAEGVLGGGSRIDALVEELAALENKVSSNPAEVVSMQAAIAVKRKEIAAARSQLTWRPMLHDHENRQKPVQKSQTKSKHIKDAEIMQQPLLWKELALLLMLQAAALENALKHAIRGEGGAAVHRSPATSPIKHTTPSAGKPSRVMAGNSGSFRGSMISQSPLLPGHVADVVAGEAPSTPKSFIPEEVKHHAIQHTTQQQQEQQQQQPWQTALCRLPYMSDGANGGLAVNSALLPLMQQLKVSFTGTSGILGTPVTA